MIDPRNPDFTNTPVSARRPRFDYVPSEPAAPAVTIVTPFYNGGAVFEDTAQSVLGQSLQQFEWLVVNDGSTSPDSLQMLERYRHKDPRMRIIDHDSNRGQGAARNTGFGAAKARYVLTLDSDDLLEPTAAEKWFWFLESHQQPTFVNGWSVIFEGESLLWPLGFQQGRANLDENFVSQTTLVRKDAHEAVGGYDEAPEIRGLEDWDFWLRCAANGFWGWTLDEYLVWYRARPADEDRWAYAQKIPRLRAGFRTRYPQLTKWFPEPALDTAAPILFREDWQYGNNLKKTTRRLLLIVAWMIMGGAEKFNLDLIRGLREAGWEVTVVTTLWSDDAWTHEFTQLTPDVFRLASFLAPSDYPRFLSYLISSRSPDVVLIINSELAYQLLPWLRCRHPQTPFLDFCHMEKEDWRGGGYPRYSIDYREMLDATIVSSDHLRNWMVQREPEKHGVEVVYTGGELLTDAAIRDTRARVRSELGVGAHIPVVLYACRICPQKQPRVFVQAMESLTRSGREFRAWVAGDGEDGPWLRETITQNGLNDVIACHGPVAVERVRDLMMAADVFFLPSESEGIALSLFEAMAAGCAVVAADVGGQRELVTDDVGLLVPRGSFADEVAAYTEALALLIGDPQLRQRMASAGRRRIAASFAVGEMHRRMLSIIERVCSDSPVFDASRVGRGTARQHALFAVRQAAVERDFMSRRAPGALTTASFVHRAYYRVATIGGPIYRFAMRRGWTFIAAANLAVKRLIHRLTT